MHTMAHTPAANKNPKSGKQSKPSPSRTDAAKRVRNRPHLTAKEAHYAAIPGVPKAEDVAAYVGRKAEGATLYVGHKAENVASYVGQKADDAGAYVGHKTEDASAAVGSRLRSLGDTVRTHGPEEGMAGDASSAVADALENSGRYLQEEGVKDVAEDVTNLIRRYPVPALLIGLAAGYLVAKGTTPRS
jgi:hypothetical protein